MRRDKLGTAGLTLLLLLASAATAAPFRTEALRVRFGIRLERSDLAPRDVIAETR
ncbi:MAG: hypothetical protein WCC53_02575 [Thermoanaerobaculia bacterium]|jgi:hypothetical protein